MNKDEKPADRVKKEFRATYERLLAMLPEVESCFGSDVLNEIEHAVSKLEVIGRRIGVSLIEDTTLEKEA